MIPHFKELDHYVWAVRSIVNGRAVPDLDAIRRRAQKEYMAEHPGYAHIWGYSPSSVVIIFAANAENEILMGATPKFVYGNKDTEASRKFYRDKLIGAAMFTPRAVAR